MQALLRLNRLSTAATLVLLWAPQAQGLQDDLPSNHPSNDPYTGGDPALLEAAGIVSMGGFEFGITDTNEIDAWLAQADIRWIETEHFEIGFGLGSVKLGREDLELLEPELATLRAALPEVPVKTRRLDPWLRAHLYALRCENLYARVQSILQVTDEDFPARAVDKYRFGEKFMGMGPYLGQRNKYEVLILPSVGLGTEFMGRHYGVSVERSQRWNVIDRDSITVAIVADQELGKSDTALHGHLAFNLAINLIDGYKMYTYELPVWLREGFAHMLEREISPKHNTFDADEGSAGQETRKSDWLAEVKKLRSKEEVTSMSKLARIRSYGELSLADHFSAWSKVQFLVEGNPDGMAKFLDRVCGLLDDQGRPDGSDFDDHQRDAFREYFGFTYPQFDEAWSVWLDSAQAEAVQVPRALRPVPGEED